MALEEEFFKVLDRFQPIIEEFYASPAVIVLNIYAPRNLATKTEYSFWSRGGEITQNSLNPSSSLFQNVQTNPPKYMTVPILGLDTDKITLSIHYMHENQIYKHRVEFPCTILH